MTSYNFSLQLQSKEKNLAAGLRESETSEVSFWNIYYFIFLKEFN